MLKEHCQMTQEEKNWIVRVQCPQCRAVWFEAREKVLKFRKKKLYSFASVYSSS